MASTSANNNNITAANAAAVNEDADALGGDALGGDFPDEDEQFDSSMLRYQNTVGNSRSNSSTINATSTIVNSSSSGIGGGGVLVDQDPDFHDPPKKKNTSNSSSSTSNNIKDDYSDYPQPDIEPPPNVNVSRDTNQSMPYNRAESNSGGSPKTKITSSTKPKGVSWLRQLGVYVFVALVALLARYLYNKGRSLK